MKRKGDEAVVAIYIWLVFSAPPLRQPADFDHDFGIEGDAERENTR